MKSRVHTVLLGWSILVVEAILTAGPLDVPCGGKHPTVYAGRVVKLARQMDRTVITIWTDAATTERVPLNHRGTNDPTPFFRINGTEFQITDWPRIEYGPGRLREGQRAAAWVCDSGEALVDWQIPQPEIRDGVLRIIVRPL
jgi:hypothetical protein